MLIELLERRCVMLSSKVTFFMLTTTIFLPSVLFQVNNIEFIFNLLYISNYNYIFYKFLELAPEALFLSIIILKLITLLFNRINHELNQWY